MGVGTGAHGFKALGKWHRLCRAEVAFRPGTYRHGLAAVEAADGRLRLCVAPIFHKGTPWRGRGQQPSAQGQLRKQRRGVHRVARSCFPNLELATLPRPPPVPLTFAGSVRTPEDGAFLNLAKGLKEPPDVVLTLLLPQHAHKELPVF